MKRLTIVIKLGTSSIVDENTHEPLIEILSSIVKTACKLQKDGHHVVLVSSGAIGVALQRMKLEKRPKHLPQVQALAAIGQCRLMRIWEDLFGLVEQPIAQILLTRNDIADRTQYLNAQNTLHELFNMRVIPIVNENDTLSVAEIKFGDNDTLSAITAGMVQADYLFLMTDVDCLYDKNPRKYPDAKPIEVVEDIADLEADVSSAGSALGTGGMGTKIVAARLATAAGVTTVITRSSEPGNVAKIINYAETLKCQSRLNADTCQSTTFEPGNGDVQPLADSTASLSSSQILAVKSSGTSTPTLINEALHISAPLHTRFLPDLHPIRDRNFWILNGLSPHGSIFIDEGASNALERKAGLLPVGIVGVEGNFAQQEAVRVYAVKRLPGSSSLGPTVDGTTSPRPGTHSRTNSGIGTAYVSGSGADSPPRFAYERHSPAPMEVARAIVNYSAAEIKRIRGLRSTEISGVLGYADSEYVALRENIALMKVERSRPTTPSFGLGAET
ncbi:putative glutamate 5-kinase [Rhizodiscina lignyota]|uniref:Glutamate 5-kinase n=1 Tax=Rhizodiscina lignyota TaxID=1504668 RepID=A0A9P4IF83_9PEZI|nr:putative glutamate 5-kinase [Rhizodiscina lignyota]